MTNIIETSKNIPKSIEKDKGGRPLKDIKYIKERKKLLDKLLTILDVSEENDIFYIDELEKNIEKQKQILEMENDVKLYFKCSSWAYFTRDYSRTYLSLIKSILKYMNITLLSIYFKDKTNKINIKKGIKLIFPEKNT